MARFGGDWPAFGDDCCEEGVSRLCLRVVFSPDFACEMPSAYFETPHHLRSGEAPRQRGVLPFQFPCNKKSRLPEEPRKAGRLAGGGAIVDSLKQNLGSVRKQMRVCRNKHLLVIPSPATLLRAAREAALWRVDRALRAAEKRPWGRSRPSRACRGEARPGGKFPNTAKWRGRAPQKYPFTYRWGFCSE